MVELVMAVVVVLAIIAAYFSGRRSGKESVDAEQKSTTVENAREAQDARADVRSASDAERRERLRTWERE